MAIPQYTAKPRKAAKRSRPVVSYNWSVLMRQDAFGFGFIAQRSAYNNEAIREGWVLVSDSNMTCQEACQFRDDLRSGDADILESAV